ncbi:hypothetical protein MAM1_0001c00003 [Mucor ambiguus]|uniref:Uncharacterized protein n=1 Tax=Mucor ambiguus TaxID=91626 RepID=A0A0C9LZE3_9FUNG|nr:hypothetical protein MAM1_0001c00003 [Mucor ambiguus]
MRLTSSGLLHKIIPTKTTARNACEEGRKLKESSAALQLPDIWLKANTREHLPHTQVSKLNTGCKTFDFSLANQNDYYHDILVPHANELNPFLSQAISSIGSKKMTLEEIKRWLQRNVKNRTKTKDIELCLENCSIFSKVIEGGIVYWRLEYDRLEWQSYGQDIIDTGVAGGIEFWRDQHPMVNM